MLLFGKDNNVKMALLSKPIYQFNATSENTRYLFFADVHKLVLKFMWKDKGQNSKSILRRIKLKDLLYLTYSNQCHIVLT